MIRWGQVSAVVVGTCLGIAFAMWTGEMGETVSFTGGTVFPIIATGAGVVCAALLGVLWWATKPTAPEIPPVSEEWQRFRKRREGKAGDTL